jgi:hypothetical protein
LVPGQLDGLPGSLEDIIVRHSHHPP